MVKNGNMAVVITISCIFILLVGIVDGNYRHDIDKNGYVVYCPCMGRFGNQADQFIGALAFAKGLNRTLVLPHWIIYPPSMPSTSLQIPFDKWFNVEPLREYHRVITMRDFMKKVAPLVWPVGMRTAFCYAFRNEKDCGMKEGNPFGPFWDHFNIDFDSHIKHAPLLWDTWDKRISENWKKAFSARMHPVYAMHGVPGHFPSLEIHQPIQKYIHFSEKIHKKADDFIKNEMQGKTYVGIHLRNGIDMVRVCDDIERGKYESLFSSAQCTGYDKKRVLTTEMCNPPRYEILRKVKQYIKNINASALFIATDNDPLIKYFQRELKNDDVTIHTWESEHDVDEAIVDLALLCKSDFFIGNCVSSFSAFVRRQRESRNKDFTFFSSEENILNSRDEL